MRTDFERMPLPELIAWEAKVHQALLKARERERKALAVRVHEMCCTYGLTPAQLFGRGRKKRKVPLLKATMPKGRRLGVIGPTMTERLIERGLEAEGKKGGKK